MEIKKSYLFFIPPGWLMCGTIKKIEDGFVHFESATYLEKTGSKTVFELINCKKLTDASATRTSIASPLEVRLDTVFFAVEMPTERVNAVYQLNNVAALKNAD